MLIIASVASTAGPAMPVPSSSEIMITPAPLATPLARPKTAEPTASRAERDAAAVERAAQRHRGDHHDAEHGADRARIEDAVDPPAEHEERQSARHHPREHRALPAVAVQREASASGGRVRGRQNGTESAHAGEGGARRGTGATGGHN